MAAAFFRTAFRCPEAARPFPMLSERGRLSTVPRLRLPMAPWSRTERFNPHSPARASPLRMSPDRKPGRTKSSATTPGT